MTIEHKNIADPDRHEPKGASTAANGQQYVANGLGSGAWAFPEPKGAAAATAGKAYITDGLGSGSYKKVQTSEYACMRATSTGVTTLLTNAYKAVNGVSLGGGITWTENIVEGLTLGLTDGYIEAIDTGVYHVSSALNFLSATVNSKFEFTLGISEGAGPIVTKEASILAKIDTDTVTQSVNCTITCLPLLNAGDRLYLMVKEATGKQMTITMFNLVATRMS